MRWKGGWGKPLWHVQPMWRQIRWQSCHEMLQLKKCEGKIYLECEGEVLGDALGPGEAEDWGKVVVVLLELCQNLQTNSKNSKTHVVAVVLLLA